MGGPVPGWMISTRTSLATTVDRNWSGARRTRKTVGWNKREKAIVRCR